VSGPGEDLVGFVRDALAAGQPRGAIRDALTAAGWPAEQADRALAAFAESEFPLPVPSPRPHVSARDTFLYLTLFTALALTVWNFGALLFTLIDIMLPDEAAMRNSQWQQYSLRWSIAGLVVAAPVFAFLTRKMNRERARSVTARLSGVRIWLGYLALYGAALTLIGDMIALIYNFLNGDLTLAVGLKILVVAGIAAAVFAYYLADLRDTEGRR